MDLRIDTFLYYCDSLIVHTVGLTTAKKVWKERWHNDTHRDGLVPTSSSFFSKLLACPLCPSSQLRQFSKNGSTHVWKEKEKDHKMWGCCVGGMEGRKSKILRSRRVRHTRTAQSFFFGTENLFDTFP